MIYLTHEIKRNISLLIALFGLKPRLSKDDYDAMEERFLADDLSECVSLIKDRFRMPEVKINVCLLGLKKFRDLFRFTWFDGVFDFLWELAGGPPIQKFSRSVWRGSYCQDNEEKGAEVLVVDLEMHSWVKRMPFESFVAIVAREIASMWLEEAGQKQMWFPMYAEILAMLAGFTYAITAGRSSGRYEFSVLSYGDLLLINDYIEQQKPKSKMITE